MFSETASKERMGERGDGVSGTMSTNHEWTVARTGFSYDGCGGVKSRFYVQSFKCCIFVNTWS